MPAKNQRSSAKPKTPSVHHIRQGSISASIWRQETRKGDMFNVTFQRGYKNGEQWKSSNTFGKMDLPVLAFVAARAYEWIGTQQPPPTRATPHAM